MFEKLFAPIKIRDLELKNRVVMSAMGTLECHVSEDGYAYLLVPSDGYKTRVPAGWLSLLVNAGDGIDLDVFLTRQPKDRMVRKLGQQLRINRSKIKETSDTNTDFDDLDGAIRSGYFLKDGLSNNEDFYYLNLLITVTAGSVDDLEWKVAEMKKLLLSQDMDVQTCSFCQEQAFLSSLPLVSLERQLYERSKRNVLTTGAASCYPFTSYEMCDDNGILLGVNKHNNSLIIVDIFDSRVYKNANIAILGTSGAGKTFTLQLMALRMRRKGIQVFIIAPLKGHEFHRACSNIGGQFISIAETVGNIAAVCLLAGARLNTVRLQLVLHIIPCFPADVLEAVDHALTRMHGKAGKGKVVNALGLDKLRNAFLHVAPCQLLRVCGHALCGGLEQLRRAHGIQLFQRGLFRTMLFCLFGVPLCLAFGFSRFVRMAGLILTLGIGGGCRFAGRRSWCRIYGRRIYCRRLRRCRLRHIIIFHKGVGNGSLAVLKLVIHI